MKLDTSQQATALALLSGPPIYGLSSWSEHIVALARSATVDDLLDEEGLKQLIEQCRDFESKATTLEAKCTYELLQGWIAEAAESVKDWASRENSQLFIEDFELKAVFERGVTELHHLGLDVPTNTHFEIVDSFPAPFDRADWSAFCPDPEDEKRFGIPAGIYLKRERLRPFLSASLVAHELIHVVPGLTGGDLLAMGLEEGIADLLGSVILSRRLIPARVSENAFVYSRWGPRDALQAAYLDHGRQAFVLFSRYGVEGLVSLLRGARREIHAAEYALVNGEIPALALRETSSTPPGYAVVARLFQIGLDHLILSPLEYCVARKATPGSTVADVSAATCLETEIVEAVLQTLAERTMMLVMSNGRIEFSNFDVYLNSMQGVASNTLRVDLKLSGA